MADDAFPASIKDAGSLSRRGFAALPVGAGLAAAGKALAAEVVETDVTVKTPDGSKPEDRAKLGPLTAPLNPQTVSRDTGAYIAWLDTQPVVNRHKKIGVAGYCMGGPYTLAAAAVAPDRVGAGGSFHGGGLVTDRPDSPHLLVPKIRATFYFGIAANDDQRQLDAKDKLRQAFADAKLAATVKVYPANHGWCVKDNPTYDAASAERAWANLTSLFGRALV